MVEARRICACCGSYDGDIHAGHVNFLQVARQYGDLHVFVVPDEIIRRNKKREPIYPQEERIKHLEHLALARQVIPLVGTDEDQVRQIIALGPTVYCFGGDQYSAFDSKLARQLRRMHTNIIRVPRYKPEDYSTTKFHFLS